MPLFDRVTPARALEGLLDRERALLLEGKIADLARLNRDKEKLAERIAREGGDRGLLEALRVTANRNQELLLQAVQGIGAVRDRLAVLRSGPVPMRTYDCDGTAVAIPAGTRKTDINHRA